MLSTEACMGTAFVGFKGARMIAGPWSSRAEFETRWLANVAALNRPAVTDRQEFECVCQAVEKFNLENPR